MAKRNYSRPIYEDGRIVGYTPAASPFRRLVAILRDNLRLTTERAEKLARELRK
jgi:hypothetical protein